MRYKKRIASLITLALIAGVFASIYFGINSPTIQRAALKILSSGNLKLNAADIKFYLFSNRILINGLNVKSSKTGQEASADSIKIRYSLLGFLRGKIVIPRMSVRGAELYLPTAAAESRRGKIGIKKLFLLRNLIIEDGEIENAHLNILEKGDIYIDTAGFEFKPRLTGEVGLKLNLQGTRFQKGTTDISIGALSLDGRTMIEDRSIDGRLNAEHIKFQDANITRFAANIAIKDKKFSITDLEIAENGRVLKGLFEVDLESQTYKADIKIPEPIPLPRLGSTNPLIDTSGLLSGEIALEGRGFAAKSISGSAKMHLTHARETLDPITLATEVGLNNGVVTLKNTLFVVKDGTISASGTINIPAKKFDVQFEGENIPIQSIFGRFTKKHFHPIFGTAKASASLTGWLKDFHVTVDAVTTGPGGYYLITTEHAHVAIDAGYNELNLTGEILQVGKKTGDVNLKIKYGKKIPGQTRPKELHLTANVYDHDLGPSFKDYRLAGTGTGSLTIDGPQQSYKGRLSAVIENGSFQGIAFQNLTANADLTYRKIQFAEGIITLASVGETKFTSPINMDFSDDGFRLYGHPTENLSFAAVYKSSSAMWDITNFNYQDLSIKGTYSPKTASNLTVKGKIDGNRLSIFKEHLRDAEGPLEIDLRLSGNMLNPSLYGRIRLDKTYLHPRIIYQRLTDLSGELIFNDHTIKSERIAGLIEDGNFEAGGSIQHENRIMQRFDLFLKGSRLRYTTEGRSFKMECDADLKWKGTRASSTISGSVNILDGRYIKDLTIFEGLAGAGKEEKTEGLFGSSALNINLRLYNTGDLAIRNNIGDIWFKADVTATGTAAHPRIAGLIEATEGEIHYLNRDFKIAHGFIEFQDPYTYPYLEISAEHEVPTIPDMVITAVLHGRTNNLVLDLSSTKPLERRDIISLLVFGVTEDEIRETQWSAQLAPSILASQVVHLIERPVTKFARLDIFRLEAAGGSDSSQQGLQISKMHMGKQLTDRLSLEFVTNINTESAEQTLRAEYLLTDYLLLKGERSSAERYKLNVSLRFRVR